VSRHRWRDERVIIVGVEQFALLGEHLLGVRTPRRRESDQRFSDHSTHACIDEHGTHLVAEEVHVGRGCHPTQQLLGGGELSAEAHRVTVHVLFFRRPYVAFEPLHERKIIGDTAEKGHGEVRVGIDEAGEDQRVAGVEDITGLADLEQFLSGTDRSNPSVGDRNRAILDRFGVRFHSQDRAADHQHVPIGHFTHPHLHTSRCSTPVDWVRLFYRVRPPARMQDAPAHPSTRMQDTRTPFHPHGLYASIDREGGGLLPLFFQSAEIAALSLLRCAAALDAFRRRRQPLHFAQLDLFRGRGRGVVGIEFASAELRHVGGLELQHLDDAAAAAGYLDPDRVTWPHGAVRLAMITVDLHPSARTRGLGLRASFEDARYVEPDIESHGVVVCHRTQFRLYPY
jgi:hypothetical protein